MRVRSAASKARTSRRSRAACRIDARSRLAFDAAISTRLTATMRCRMSDTSARLGWLEALRGLHELGELRLGRPGGHHLARVLHALGHRAGHAGAMQRDRKSVV